MEIRNFYRPASLDEAYELVVAQGGQPLGGGAWSASTGTRMDSCVDLGALGLRYIREEYGHIAIGAMATARDMETSEVLAGQHGALFAKALGCIAGVQVRNIVSAGGSVAGRYGFSELLVVLLSLDASLVLYGEGEKRLSAFLDSPRDKPFLLEKILIAPGVRSGYQSLKQAATDFPILSVCASFRNTGWKIAVGSRPQVACISIEAGRSLGLSGKPDQAAAGRAGCLAAAELVFGDDLRASASYRKAICPVLVARALMEAAS